MSPHAPALWVRAFVACISLYQVTLSPDHSYLKVFFPHGVCRYKPTCSEYAKEALLRHGWRGVGLAVKRVLRCHPGREGGIDPVPEL